MSWKYHYCKVRMTAYINGELPLKSRRRMARYIAECPRCAEAYENARALRRELEMELPALGQPTRQDLDRVWRAIQGEMRHQRPASVPHWLRYRTSYGAAVIAILVALLLPLTFDRGSTTRASATPPVPTQEQLAASTDTPHPSNGVRLVAVASAVTITVEQTVTVSTTFLKPEAAPTRTPAADSGN